MDSQVGVLCLLFCCINIIQRKSMGLMTLKTSALEVLNERFWVTIEPKCDPKSLCGNLQSAPF